MKNYIRNAVIAAALAAGIAIGAYFCGYDSARQDYTPKSMSVLVTREGERRRAGFAINSKEETTLFFLEDSDAIENLEQDSVFRKLIEEDERRRKERKHRDRAQIEKVWKF